MTFCVAAHGLRIKSQIKKTERHMMRIVDGSGTPCSILCSVGPPPGGYAAILLVVKTGVV